MQLLIHTVAHSLLILIVPIDRSTNVTFIITIIASNTIAKPPSLLVHSHYKV